MSRIDRRKQRRLEIYKEIERLVEEMNWNVDLVIVEGQHDKRTLEELGYKANTILSCSTMPFNRLVEQSSRGFSRVVILTDFDEEGEKVSKALTSIMEERRIKVDRFYRREFRKLLRKAGLTTIESIFKLKRELFPL